MNLIATSVTPSLNNVYGTAQGLQAGFSVVETNRITITIYTTKKDVLMKQITTYSNLIWSFDGAMSDTTCSLLQDHMSLLKFSNQPNIDGRMPWEDQDDLPYNQIQDITVKRAIEAYRFTCSQLVYQVTRQFAYPNYTDLVLWRPGRQMHEHKDNGYTDDSNLRPRVWSSVTYLNDDYQGGVTFIKNERGEYYSSAPRKGRIVIFLAGGSLPAICS